MRYRITHRTVYIYDSPVHESFNEVRLRPVSDANQTCLDFELKVDPPASVISFMDYYGNEVHDFSVPYLHDRLEITATSDVVTFGGVNQPLTGPAGDDLDRSPPLAGLATEPVFQNDRAEYLIPSTYVALEAETAKIARSLLETDPGMTAHAFLLAATAWVRQQLEYQVGTTTVHSKVAEVLAGGRGVCQDFSHVLIAICRQAGLPARYVSGYLGNVSKSEASHAWVEAFIPPYGWVGMDATSGDACTGRHVKIGVGRDYADVTVIRGTYRGGQAREMEVTVTSEAVGETLGITLGSERRRGEMIQYQSLGTMRQLQRIGAMSRQLSAMNGMSQRQGGHDVSYPAEMQTEVETPRNQPQQQQQG
jgi:transglutaminase-like putative cysteine protease